MHGLGGTERGGNAERLRQAVKACRAVVLKVLTCVKHVESAGPQGDRAGKDQDAGIEAAAHGDPGRRGGQTQGQAEYEVGPAGDALHIAVTEEHHQHEGRKVEG